MHALLAAAVDDLCSLDEYLLAADVSERSLSHMLAVRLWVRLPNFDIDCEYNRDGFSTKKLMLSDRTTQDDALDAVTVFPDIVVHKRGRQDHNLLVLEMKKAASSVSHDYDIEKLVAFKNELQYRYAAHIVIGYTRAGLFVREVKWQ